MGTSPEGTAEILRDPSAVPPGLIGLWRRVPNVETLGYCRMSLRDNDLACFAGLLGERFLAALDIEGWTADLCRDAGALWVI